MKKISHAKFRRGVSLLELGVTLMVLVAIAGVAVAGYSTVQQNANDQGIQAELRTLADAVCRFKADMGEYPQCIAELMKSPNSANLSGGGWWWRTGGAAPTAVPVSAPLTNSNGAPSQPPPPYDPLTRRGWNGPYIQPELTSPYTSGATYEVEERRLNSTGAVILIQSNGAARTMPFLRSDYGNYTQKSSAATRWRSHYNLVFVNDPAVLVTGTVTAGKIYVRYYKDPTIAAPDVATNYFELYTGITYK